MCLEAKLWRDDLRFSMFEPEATSPVLCYASGTFTGYKSCRHPATVNLAPIFISDFDV